MAWWIRPTEERLQSDATGLCAAHDGREERLAFSHDIKSSHKARDKQLKQRQI